MGLKSIFKKIVKPGMEAIPVLGPILDAVDQFFETDEDKQEWRRMKAQMVSESENLQYKLNVIEAKSKNIFKSGWRPALGWLCVTIIACHWLVFPVAATLLIHFFDMKFIVPPIDAAEAFTLVSAMLGLTTARTYEKKMGLTK